MEYKLKVKEQIKNDQYRLIFAWKGALSQNIPLLVNCLIKV